MVSARVRAEASTGDVHDYVLDLLVSHDAVSLTYDECAGVSYDEVHADPDGAMERIVARYHQVAEKSDAVVIVGADGLITWASPAVRTVLGPAPDASAQDHRRQDRQIGGRQCLKALSGLLKQAVVAAQNQKLLGKARARQRPQAGAMAAGHDEGQYRNRGHALVESLLKENNSWAPPRPAAEPGARHRVRTQCGAQIDPQLGAVLQGRDAVPGHPGPALQHHGGRAHRPFGPVAMP